MALTEPRRSGGVLRRLGEVTGTRNEAPDLLAVDVVVVGGGPGGSAAAIELARSGRSVVLIDKAVFPRDKCCGDGLTTLALRELEHLGFDGTDVSDWQEVDGAVIRAPSGLEIRVPLPEQGLYAAITPRLQLDDALIRLARSHGVDVRDGSAFSSVEKHDDHIVVRADGLEVTARYVIAADGMWSPVRKAIAPHATPYLGEWHGARQYASGVTGRAADELFVWFEPDLIPGYAWSFPLPGGRTNVGFGVLRSDGRKGKEMKELWDALVQRPHIAEALGPDFRLDDRSTAWPIPARVDQIELAVDRVLFVGDAAAATDVMTGEGIGQALLTGRLAAESVIAAGALRPDQASEFYRAEVHHHLFADHKMSLLLNRILASERGASGAIRIVANSGTWGKRNFARWMFEDEPRALVATPSRWHRKLLSRPGAYSDR